MRLVTIRTAEGPRVFVRAPHGLVDVAQADPGSPWAGASMRELLAGGEDAASFLRSLPVDGSGVLAADARVTYLAPVLDPPRIFCIGRNYVEHAREGKADLPGSPMIFLKPNTGLAGHDEAVYIPASTDRVDWEGELAVVVGLGGRDIPESDAFAHVAGYMVANDLTARDWQRRTSQFDAGKMFDGFAPMGPDLVTVDEIDDVGGLEITTRLNGEVMQHGHIREMVFSIPQLISYISQAVRLLPGDIILTGTPAGVGYARTPPVFIQAGDTVSVTISHLGELSNTFTAVDPCKPLHTRS